MSGSPTARSRAAAPASLLAPLQPTFGCPVDAGQSTLGLGTRGSSDRPALHRAVSLGTPGRQPTAASLGGEERRLCSQVRRNRASLRASRTIDGENPDATIVADLASGAQAPTRHSLLALRLTQTLQYFYDVRAGQAAARLLVPVGVSACKRPRDQPGLDRVVVPGIPPSDFWRLSRPTWP